MKYIKGERIKLVSINGDIEPGNWFPGAEHGTVITLSAEDAKDLNYLAVNHPETCSIILQNNKYGVNFKFSNLQRYRLKHESSNKKKIKRKR